MGKWDTVRLILFNLWKPNLGECALERSWSRLNRLKQVVGDIWAPCFGCESFNTFSHTHLQQREGGNDPDHLGWQIGRPEKITSVEHLLYSTYCAKTCVNIIAFPPQNSVHFTDEGIEVQRDKLPKATQLLIMEPRFQVQSLSSSFSRASASLWIPSPVVGTSLQ